MLKILASNYMSAFWLFCVIFRKMLNYAAIFANETSLRAHGLQIFLTKFPSLQSLSLNKFTLYYKLNIRCKLPMWTRYLNVNCVFYQCIKKFKCV